SVERTAEPPDAVTHLPFVCNHLGADNVMTAWALGPEDKAEVLIRFLIEYHSHQEDLEHPTTELKDMRRDRLLTTLQHLNNQLQALPADASPSQIDSIRQTAKRVSSMKREIAHFGKRTGDQEAADKIQNDLEQLSKPDADVGSEKVEEMKQTLSS